VRRGTSLTFGWTIFVCCVVASATARAAEPTASESEFFEKEVRPLLVAKCGACHGGAARPKGKLRLTSRDDILRGGESGAAVEPGKPDDSLLVKAVRYQGDLRMPPSGKLTDRQIETIERWVKAGAPWPGAIAPTAPKDSPAAFAITEQDRGFWSFRPVKSNPPPAAPGASWPRGAIDQFILAELETKGITPAAAADKRTLLRRATYDLIGLPPTPAEVDAFLADDSPEAFARVVDRLLASPLYGERWGRHWLDVVRYADARDLIQLPPESDFREAWRYRDWVVDSFNRDTSYADFIRYQVAGDLLPSSGAEGATREDVNKEGLIATGLLAIADFVPGDVDKDQMVADYVNDQIDVVSRAFLGLSIACARCHDHKFDPISTEDYYALSGIFFSTRIIPGPVAGNTPLVRVPLLSASETAALQATNAADARRRAELEQLAPDAADREYRAHLVSLLTGKSARYLAAACECRKVADADKQPIAADVAKREGLDEATLAEWIALLDHVEKQPSESIAASGLAALKDFAERKLAGDELAKSAATVQESFGAEAKREQVEAARSPEKEALAHAALLRFRADDPRISADATGRVTLWPNCTGLAGDAAPPAPQSAPMKATAMIEGHARPVVRFDGETVLEAGRTVPPAGTMFIVFQTAPGARHGERIVGWEDADSGQHGLGLMTAPEGALHAILRNRGQSGDIVDATRPTGFESVCVTWGPNGTILRRNGVETAAPTKIDCISSDPKITALKIGGPGSGASPRFRGDVAEIRVYRGALDEDQRKTVEAELREAWFAADAAKQPLPEPLAALYSELLSSRGPFWAPAADRSQRLSPESQQRIAALDTELATLKNKRPLEVPQAVACQDGGPKGTRHEGFQDAHVFIRGDHKKLGQLVPRGFPKVLTGDQTAAITEGSGRLQLANWLTAPENPLPARVMVNRIWQHHFGQGLVATPNDFGRRGERPTHAELLDHLAARFVESGWSVKTMHRLMMLSSAYQQSTRASALALAGDPENKLLARMNRRRLDAEAIRDTLLFVSGRLNTERGGPPFTDLDTPRRTLYLMAARTGANTSEFGRLFDRADPSMIVAERGQSVVAPQALFFLNDPFVNGMAKALAARVAREAPANAADRIRYLYSHALCRQPTQAEIDVGAQLLNAPAVAGGPDPLERYCLLLLSTNELLYVE
jgi:hypothetical protein